MGIKHQQDTRRFLSEMGWKIFKLFIVFCPILKKFRAKFDNFPWINNTEYLLTLPNGSNWISYNRRRNERAMVCSYVHNNLG